MNCPECGDVCRCPSEPLPAASSQGRPEPETESALVASSIACLEPESSDPDGAEMPAAEDPHPSLTGRLVAAVDSARESVPDGESAPAWRDELSARLNRYRARRKVRPPRYPSLSLQFNPLDLSASASAGSSPVPVFEPVSNHALALDGMRQAPSAAAETEVKALQSPVGETAQRPKTTGHFAAHSGAKIIEFPGFAWGPPVPPPDQLAEPVNERPRILEVPEVEPPPPALGGITMEAAEHAEAQKRPGIDVPLLSAPLGLRLAAALIDGVIIAAASALFGGVFWKMVAVRPPLVQVLGLAAGIPAVLWAAYQYLLIVYACSTPGLHVAGLELARFDGTATNRRLRRWRVLTACLSAVSAGMGYAWVFLDEDALCWHDRITHTYLAPKRRESKTEGR